LMAASSKGYGLDKSQTYWIFGLVYNLCDAKHWDQINKTDELVVLEDGFWKRHLPKLTTMQKSLVYNLQFRKAYGGLPGDKRLINSLTNIWINRFLKYDVSGSNALLTGNGEDKPIRFLSPPEEALTLEQWILPAIDFHCAPNITSILSDKYDEFTQEDIKATIWHCSSKYNDRTVLIRTEQGEEQAIDKKYKKVWEKIRPQFYSLANYFLIHNY